MAPSKGMAALAGAVAAAVALATAEAVGAIGGEGRSLVVSVGDGFVELTSGVLAGPAIESLGSANKPALLTGIVVVSLALGALLGTVAARRWWIGPAGFAAFGLLGALAASNDPGADTAPAVIAAGVAVLAGSLCLRWLLAFAPAATAGDDEVARQEPGTASRRAFFGFAGAAGAAAGLVAAGARRLGGPSVAQEAREAIALPPATTSLGADARDLGVDGVSPYITPNSQFYRIDTALLVPQVDPADWRLEITGMVDEPYSLDYDELLEMSTTEAAVTLACVSNLVGGDLVGNAVWQGVALGDLLDRAGVVPGATQIVGRSVDRFTVGFPTEVAFDGRNALVAVGMNGEPLPIRNGFPARLVVSGLYGYVSATKWLSEIELTTWEGFDAYWVPRGWSKEGPIRTQSRIDVPHGSNDLEPGPVTVAGVAWAPNLGIEAVEVRVDEGPWQLAELGEVLSDDTWRQWALVWDATPGEHLLEVRATDGTGETQTGQRQGSRPSGATGWHRRRVQVRG